MRQKGCLWTTSTTSTQVTTSLTIAAIYSTQGYFYARTRDRQPTPTYVPRAEKYSVNYLVWTAGTMLLPNTVATRTYHTIAATSGMLTVHNQTTAGNMSGKHTDGAREASIKVAALYRAYTCWSSMRCYSIANDGVHCRLAMRASSTACVGSMGSSTYPSIEVLPISFLDRCTGLKEVDLSPLANLGEVNAHFLGFPSTSNLYCTGIKSIDLTPLRAVEVLPKGFLSGCSSLEEVDLSPLVRL